MIPSEYVEIANLFVFLSLPCRNRLFGRDRCGGSHRSRDMVEVVLVVTVVTINHFLNSSKRRPISGGAVFC